MTKVGIFYGSTTGKTEMVVESLQKEFGQDVVDLHNIADVDESDFEEYTNLIVACPTWNIGELQSDWDGFFPDLDSIDFSSKKVAYFGTGDRVGYADNFQDAMGILEEKIAELGGTTVGYWSTDGYDFNESKALKDGKFVGLASDEDNQSDLTDERVKAWVAQLKKEFGI
ncbi:MAG: flavodoxin FldA [Xenococcaceae cyanobacterium]